MGVLDAPEPKHASETARQPRGSAAPKRTMRREFTEFEDEQDDLNDDGDNWEILTAPNAFEGVVEAIKKANVEVVHSALGMVPQNYIKLEGAPANQMIRLLETLEDTDDVQNVYSNFDVDQEQLEEVAG